MSKCQICIHYEYKAGIAPSLAKALGKSEWPTRPTCYCLYAGVSWPGQGADVRKPSGIACDYKAREFSCTDCGGHNIKRALILNAKAGEMVCLKCMEKHAAEREAHNE